MNEEGKDRGVEDKGKEPEVSGDKGNEGQEKEENKSKEKPKKGSKGKEKAEDQPQEIMEENTKEEKKTEVKKKSSIMLRVLGGLGIVKGWGGDSGKARGNEKANGRDPKRDGRREASPRGSSPRGRRGSRGYRVHIHNNAEVCIYLLNLFFTCLLFHSGLIFSFFLFFRFLFIPFPFPPQGR